MQEDREGVKKAFREVDKNQDGRITKDECREIFLDLFPGCWTIDDLDDLFEAADIDGNGYLDYNEFVDWIYSVEGEEVPPEPDRSQHHNGALRFSDDPDVVDAASAAAEGPKRSVRARINTGFEFENKQGLQFNDSPEQLDAASSASGGPKRSVRQRINTGFERGVDEATTTKRAPQFTENAEELEAASLASSGPKRSVRARINTGFERNDNSSANDSSKSKGGLKFQDSAEELDAASLATDGPKRSVRSRINTGFEKDAPKEKAPQFNDDAEEFEAASSANGSGRSVRSRINTGFEKKAKGKGLQFDEDAEELEAASEATAGKTKSVRSRINTGFERQEDAPKEQRKPLKFNDTAEELEAASSASGKASSVRARINTGFEKNVLPPEDSNRRGLQFNDSREELDAASSASGSGRAVRARVNTGFARDDDAPKENRSALNFDDNVEHHEAASESSANPRSTRSRVNTGFFTPENPDGDEEEARTAGRSTLQFKEDTEVFDAASASASGPGRKCRSRINTGFILTPDSDEEEEPVDIRTRLSMKRQSRVNSRSSLRESLTSFQSEGTNPIHMNAMCHALSLVADMAPDSPEFTIDDREITDEVEKDQELLITSLRKNHLFEDLEDEAIRELVEEMCVYRYDDGENAIRQGDAGGTHFFVVAQGVFEIVKDDVIVAEIAAGATFGESVLLGDGVRQATVRAKGSGQLYGMIAADVRDMMQMRYEEKYKETMNAVVKVLDSGSCAQLLNLNAFQRHELYTVPTIRTLSEGEVLLNAGPISIDEVYVLVQGSLVMTADGEDLKNGRVPRYSMVGMEAFLFGTMRFCIKADSVVKLLVISRSCLEDLLTPSRVPTVLLRPLVDRELSKEAQVQSMHEEQRELLTQSFVIRKIAHGEDFDVSDVRLLLCMEGEIEASKNGFASRIEIQSGKNNVVGLDKFFKPTAAWDLHMRAANKNKPAFAAVWYSDSATEVLDEHAKGGKIRILKHVFLFRTLSKSQLLILASAMEMKRYAPDDIIFSQGDMGDTFCIIDKGRVFIEKDGRYIRALGPDDYFGERALLNREPRSATIKASQDCEIWCISSKDFHEALPPAALQYLQGRAELQDAEYKFEDLLFTRVVGSGGFGTVKMVKTAAKGIRYAMKCIKKRPIVEHNQQQAILNEKDVLLSMDHPFIVRLVQTFRNKAYVYFLMELITGGELLDAINSLGGELNKVQTQFYAGSIILALEHLHSRRIAYLDLKSENVMLDHQGYIKLVDFGLAEKVEGGLYGAKGTPHFMAPEMLTSRSPYDTTADLWALGVSCFEFMCGELPFGKDSNSKSEVFSAVLKAAYIFPQSFQEKPYAPEATSLINGLLCTDPKRRLGGGLAGFKALFEHVFFKGFFWDDLLARRLTPPYVPEGERYAEGRNKDPMNGKKLSDVEAKAEKEELKSGWKDPDPGWDDDFSPGDDE